jgi:ribosome biogenesis GTPase
MTDVPDQIQAREQPLSSWGFDDHFRARFDEVAEAGDRPARVVRADRGSWLVVHENGESRAAMARQAAGDTGPPTTGDFVVLRDGEVAAVLERRTALFRASPDPGRGPQVLAANVEFVLVAEPLGERFRPRRIERLLVVAWSSGALPIVVLTKSDREPDLEAALNAARRLAPGVACLGVSPLTGDGVKELAEELSPGTTSVVIGRSGAGKSTLANALSGGAANLATGEVRHDNKGRHTTVARELVRLENGALLIDTPGVRAIGLLEAEGAIGEAFSELESLFAACRFSDCAHDTEPGCAVREAIAAGELDPGRFESYQRLQREQARIDARNDPRLRAERAAHLRRFAKEVRQLPHR